MNSSALISEKDKRLVHAWLLIAIGAAAIAGTLAFLVAMTRTPGVRILPSERSFHVILVGHVTFALTIWLQAFISTVWSYVAAQAGLPLNRRVGWAGVIVSLLGAAIISVPIVLFQGVDVMNDYVPLLDTPLFFAGYVVFVAGIGITAANYLAGVLRYRRAGTNWAGASPAPTLPLTAYGMACTAVAMLVGLSALGLATFRLGLGANGRTPFDYYEAMFWGMGHSFQYVNSGTMVVVWYALIGLFLGQPRVNQKFAKGLFTLFAVFPFVTLVPYFVYADPMALLQHKAWGILLDIGLSLPIMFLGPMILVWVWRAGAKRASPVQWLKQMPFGDPRVMAFAFSAALFAFGLYIHPAVRQGTLRTPAHYHSVVVGGVTMAFMGLAYHLLAQVDRKVVWRRVAMIQPYLFAIGIMVLVLGLLGAGTLGAPRKTYDAAVTGAAWLKPMVVMGAGAGVAAFGGALFVAVMLWSLIHRKSRRSVIKSALAGAGD